MACDYLRRAARGDLPAEDESYGEDDDTELDDEFGLDWQPVGLPLVRWFT